MAARFSNPFPQFWSSSAVYSGGTLNFYVTGTSTPLAVYSDETLVTSLGTSITLNSAGRPSTNIFLQNTSYKVVLQDSDGIVIWTADPVRPSDFLSFPKWSVGSGSPNGVLAGTAASSGIMPDKYWDYTNSIEYTCTTTGSSSTAVWTALNASASTPSVPAPQGRLTLTSATPVISADVIAATSVYYTPYHGNLIPIYNGSSFTPTVFSELSLTLASQHAANTIYDVFAFSNSGVLTLVTGPAWSNSTANSGSRGTGAGTTEYARVQGFLTNAVQITGRNGSSTYTVPANQGTYVGSIFIDATAGQVTCHRSWGTNRKDGVSNAYNRVRILMKGGENTGWSWGTNSWRAVNDKPTSFSSNSFNVGSGTTCNSIIVFTGLAEEEFRLEYRGKMASNSSYAVGVGWNATNALSGFYAATTAPNSTAMSIAPGTYIAPPSLGINVAIAIENALAGTSTLVAGEDDSLLTAEYWS